MGGISNKIELKGIGWGGTHWIHLAQDRDKLRAFVSTLVKPRIP